LTFLKLIYRKLIKLQLFCISLLQLLAVNENHIFDMKELPEVYYPRLSTYLEEITFNILFARAVIERMVGGQVYVDHVAHPRTYYIVHPYGMSLLGGDFTNAEFNSAFRRHGLNTDRKRTKHEWMQVYPHAWNFVLINLFGEQLIKAKENLSEATSSVVELNTRVNFVFNKNAYLKNRSKRNIHDPRIRIVKSTKFSFDEMVGSVVPRTFWNNSNEFIDKGVSFTLYYEDKLASTAFSSFLAPGKLELGIETSPDFRGMGLAEKVCTALIDYCLNMNLEPVWACRWENTGSYKLAQRLDFVPTIELPYYRLSN